MILLDFFVKINVLPLFNKLYVRVWFFYDCFYVLSQSKRICAGIKFNFKNKSIGNMKKYVVICVGLCVALAFTSCKSSESAYRKAYEKAKAQENNGEDNYQGNEEIAVVAPIVETPATESVVVDNVDNVPVRTESLSMVNGNGLKNFSVVVGSFSVQANAEGLQATLQSRGYDAQIAYNPSIDMYRVVAATFDIKSDAVRSRNELRSQFPDAWLLSNQ